MMHEKEVKVSKPRPSSSGHKKRTKLECTVRHILFSFKQRFPFGLD